MGQRHCWWQCAVKGGRERNDVNAIPLQECKIITEQNTRAMLLAESIPLFLHRLDYNRYSDLRARNVRRFRDLRTSNRHVPPILKATYDHKKLGTSVEPMTNNG